MTQKKLTVPFLTLRPGEYSSVSDAATAIIRYNLLLNRLEVSLDSSPYTPFGAGGDGYLYDQLVAAPQTEPLLDGYVAYIDGYSTELNKVSIEDILSLGVGGGVASVSASSPLVSSGGANPVVSFPTWPANASGALSNDGYGNLSWSSSPGGGISGTIAATQIAFGTGTDTLGGESGLTWDTAQKLARVSNSGNYTDLLSTGVFAKAAGVGSNEVEISIDDGSGLPVITALNGATGGIVDLTPGSIRFREQSAAPAPSPFVIDVDSNTLKLGTVDALGVEIGSTLAAVTISGAFTLPVVDGANGEVLTTDGTGAVSWAAVPSTPSGGPTDSVQINDGYGGFIGYSGLTWNNSQSTLTAPVLALAEGTAPAGTSARGKLWANSAANARPYWTDDTGQTYNLTLDRFNTITPAATVVIDASPDLPVFNSLSVDQDTTFTTANLGPGRSASVRVVCDGTTRSLTFPTGPGGWTWLGSGPPSVLAAGDVGYLSITAYGTTDADVVAAWSYENMPAGISGMGTDNQVVIWSGSYTQDGSANFTFNGTTLGLVGGLSQSAGAVNLTANAASSLTTSSGSLTLTSAAAATWSTAAGNLAITSASSLQLAAAAASEVVVNDSGLASNFRVESDTNANMLFVDGTNNRVGFGTATPLAALDLASGQFAIPDGTAAAPAISFRDDLNTGIFSPTNDIFGVAVNGSEAVRIQQSAGTPVVLIGTSTVYGAITVDSGSTDGTAGAVMLGHANAGTVLQESYRGGQFAGVRSRGTKAAPTQIGAGDGMVSVLGTGWTNTSGINYGALITMKAEQAFTSTASGGRIEFHTTTNGTDGFTTLGGATTERMRITNAGLVGIGTSTPSALLSVGASSQFQVDSSGNLARINNIPYTFPSAQGAAGTILTNDGYGALSWAENAAQATSAPISTKSSNYTMTTADGTILVDATSGNITVTLPTAASAVESIFTIKKKDVTFHTVTVDANGAELIDGAATYVLSTQYEAIKIQSDGSAWWII